MRSSVISYLRKVVPFDKTSQLTYNTIHKAKGSRPFRICTGTIPMKQQRHEWGMASESHFCQWQKIPLLWGD